jgi:hypothetical protein
MEAVAVAAVRQVALKRLTARRAVAVPILADQAAAVALAGAGQQAERLAAPAAVHSPCSWHSRRHRLQFLQ